MQIVWSSGGTKSGIIPISSAKWGAKGQSNFPNITLLSLSLSVSDTVLLNMQSAKTRENGVFLKLNVCFVLIFRLYSPRGCLVAWEGDCLAPFAVLMIRLKADWLRLLSFFSLLFLSYLSVRPLTPPRKQKHMSNRQVTTIYVGIKCNCICNFC